MDPCAASVRRAELTLFYGPVKDGLGVNPCDGLYSTIKGTDLTRRTDQCGNRSWALPAAAAVLNFNDCIDWRTV